MTNNKYVTKTINNNGFRYVFYDQLGAQPQNRYLTLILVPVGMKNMNSWFTFPSWPFLKSLYMTKINDLKMTNLDIAIFRWIISARDIEIFRYSTKKVQTYSLQTYFFTFIFLNDLKTWFKLWYRRYLKCRISSYRRCLKWLRQKNQLRVSICRQYK